MKNKNPFPTLGSSTFAIEDREENDFYATEPKAIDCLLEKETFCNEILEPFCGMGHLSKRLEEFGYNVTSTDLIDRGFGLGGVDFFKRYTHWDGDIITNPPYKIALNCVKHSLEVIEDGHKIAMFLKLQFLESKERRDFFELFPPKKVLVASKRLICAKNGDFDKYKSSAVAYAWFVWEKGFNGKPTIDWIN